MMNISNMGGLNPRDLQKLSPDQIKKMCECGACPQCMANSMNNKDAKGKGQDISIFNM
jgi:hypothetical protein